MASNPQLLYAILAMDVYHRGDAGGINALINERPAGIDDTVPLAADPFGDHGFSAHSYSHNGEVIIAYRGTDDGTLGTLWNTVPYIDPTKPDFLYGYQVGLGAPLASQAEEAVEFYRQYFAQPFIDQNNAVIIGQSLGGGLAGYVASIFGQRAYVFDSMPYNLAVLQAQLFSYRDSLLPDVLSSGVRDFLYGDHPIIAPNGGRIAGSYVSGEFLEYARLPGRLLGQYQFSSFNPYDPLGTLTSGTRHTPATLVTLMFAEQLKETSWKDFMRHVWPAWVDKQVAEAVGYTPLNEGSANNPWGPDHVMAVAVAYTAVDFQGPFGTSAIRALFGDSNQVGRFLDKTGDESFLASKEAKDALGEIIVQFAGDLALQNSTSVSERRGVVSVSDEGKFVFLDFDPERWVKSTVKARANGDTTADAKIIGRDKLIEHAFTSNGADRADWQGNPGDITRALIAYGTAEAILSGENAPSTGRDKDGDGENDPGGSFLVGGEGADQLVGGDADDVLIGGKGNDRLHAKNGRDAVFGSDGDDIIVAEASKDYDKVAHVLSGGDGADKFIVGSMDPVLDWTLEDLIPNLKITITDASADDTLWAAYNFFNESAGQWEGSQLFPLLGGFIESTEGGVTYASLHETYLISSLPEQGPNDPPPPLIDYTQGLIPFTGYVSYRLEGGSLFIDLARGQKDMFEGPADWGPDAPIITRITNVWGNTGVTIEVQDWDPGDLGIYLIDAPTDAARDAALPQLLNGGVLGAPLDALAPTPAEPRPDIPEDGTASPDQPVYEPPSGSPFPLGTAADEYFKLPPPPNIFDPPVTIDAGGGSDTASVETATGPVSVDLATGATNYGYMLANFEDIVGTAFSDTLSGNSGTNRI